MLKQNKHRPYLNNIGRIKELYIDEMAEFLLNFDKTKFKDKADLKEWLNK